MTAHKHAKLMAEYAKDALKTEKPWELWEWSNPDNGDNWCGNSMHPFWSVHLKYRRKRIPICEVEGRKVFEGDRLWSYELVDWIDARRSTTQPGYLVIGNSNLHPCAFSWSKPKEKKSGWINIYPIGKNGYSGGEIYPTKDIANARADKDRMDCVEVHWEE
jgi:hypothetical protein